MHFAMKDDFIATLKSARDLAMALLKHEYGEFPTQQSWKASRVLMSSKHSTQLSNKLMKTEDDVIATLKSARVRLTMLKHA